MTFRNVANPTRQVSKLSAVAVLLLFLLFLLFFLNERKPKTDQAGFLCKNYEATNVKINTKVDKKHCFGNFCCSNTKLIYTARLNTTT
jgi:hypothetical protein